MITNPDVLKREKLRSEVLRANTKAYRYMLEISYAHERADSLLDFLASEQVSKPKTLDILDEVQRWRQRVKNYEKYVDRNL